VASEKLCSVDGCGNLALARGWCNKHWQRWRKHGSPDYAPIEPLPKECTVAGCERKPHTRWKQEAVCNMHWQRLYRHGSAEERDLVFSEWALCEATGCDKPSRAANSGFCEMHYMRLRRTGSLDLIARKAPIKKKRVYVMEVSQGHPLACKKGHISAHRKALFARIGWGPHPCYWCGCELEWRPGGKTSYGSLVVDHLDGNGANNSDANLVPSCHLCNTYRGFHKKWLERNRRADGYPADPRHPFNQS
jgi:hypothetical protein